MKEEFVLYLESIGITNTLRDRIEAVHEFYQEICPDDITGIFITDYIKKGEREYDCLWFFSEKYCMEAKQFILKDDFDITPLHKHVYYWRIQKQDYDFKEATEASRLHLVFHLDTGITGELKASGENCDYLRDITLEYVAPNLKE
jgi:hypothetical protein